MHNLTVRTAISHPDTMPQVSRTCKALARLIFSRNLRPGDRLPNQTELRDLLHASNDTLSMAMRTLVQKGVLTRRNRAGTVLVNPAPLLQLNWTVGVGALLAPESGPSAVYASLLTHVLAGLFHAGCRCDTYFRRENPCWPLHHLDDFAGLREDADSGRLDALVLLTTLAREEWRALTERGIVVAHIGNWLGAPAGAVIDWYGFVAEAWRDLLAQNCRQVLLVDGHMGDWPHCSALEFTTPATPAVAWFRAPLPTMLPVPPLAEGALTHAGAAAGRLVACELLARPPPERPDGVIATDDYAAKGMTEVLVEQEDYRPRLAVMTNRTLPLHFALPVTAYELDPAELCVRGLASLLQRLRNPAEPECLQHVVASPPPS